MCLDGFGVGTSLGGEACRSVAVATPLVAETYGGLSRCGGGRWMASRGFTRNPVLLRSWSRVGWRPEARRVGGCVWWRSPGGEHDEVGTSGVPAGASRVSRPSLRPHPAACGLSRGMRPRMTRTGAADHDVSCETSWRRSVGTATLDTRCRERRCLPAACAVSAVVWCLWRVMLRSAV